jgi:pimeloyl-ACP methyl ester carboxylesterase
MPPIMSGMTLSDSIKSALTGNAVQGGSVQHGSSATGCARPLGLRLGAAGKHCLLGLIRTAMRVSAFALALVIAPAQVHAQSIQSKLDLSAYVHPSRLVDIGGRKLNLLCIGRGSPTVVFEAQLGEAAWNWARVHSLVAQHSRACIYDRAGLGFSDPSNRPGTTVNAAQDLSELLSRAEEKPPYLLVGASYGAMIARYFAAKHAGSVSGVVLVDGHHEDEFKRINQLSSGKYAAMMDSFGQGYRQCAAAARAHITPDSSEYKACVGPPPAFANRELAAAHLAQALSPDYWTSSLSEWENLNSLSADQVRTVNSEMRHIHVLALIRSISPFADPTKPASALSVAVEQENMRMQQETASLSATGTTRIIPRAGHAIHLDNPADLTRAVLDTLARVRR